MSVVAAAVIGGAVVGAGASYMASKEQSKAAEAAAEAQTEISDESLALTKELAEQQREDFAPWREAGESALQQIQEGIETGAFEVGDVDVTQDPGYAFRMSEGIEALDKSAAARGRLLSGAQQKGVSSYAQNLASQEYANAYARQASEKATKYNILSNLSSGGQASAAGQAQATGQLSSTSSNILSNLGSSQAQSAYSSGAANASAYTGAATAVNQAAQNWLLYKNLGAS